MAMSPSTLNPITCVVPTHNRPQFLRRLLKFYCKFPPNFPFLIVDSSSPAAAQENREIIRDVGEVLEISYQHRDEDFITKCTAALESLHSPFVVFCADDDLLFPDAVHNCMAFLSKQSSYSVALGIHAAIYCYDSTPDHPCHAGSGYPLRDESVLERCRRIALYPFSTFYGVHRTESLRDSFQITASNLDGRQGYFLAEHLLLQLSVLKGRIQVFPEIYALREGHGAVARLCPKILDDDQAEGQLNRFMSCLSAQLEKAGIGRKVAEKRVERWYGYLRDSGLTQSQRAHKKMSIRRFRKFLRRTWMSIWNLFFQDGILHRRQIRPSDLIGQKAIWNAAIQIISSHPHGIAAEKELRRSA